MAGVNVRLAKREGGRQREVRGEAGLSPGLPP